MVLIRFDGEFISNLNKLKKQREKSVETLLRFFVTRYELKLGSILRIS